MSDRREYNQQYYQQNQEALRDRQRRHYQENSDRIRKRVEEYQDRNAESIRKKRASQLRDLKISLVSLRGGKCEDCGWDLHPAGLDFHHRDRASKLFQITGHTLRCTKKYPWEMVMSEMEKCDLLCANCHRVRECTWDLEGVWPSA